MNRFGTIAFMPDPVSVGSTRNGQVERVPRAARQTYTASPAAVTGGTLVEHVVGDRKCQTAGAASVRVAGMAAHDAAINAQVLVVSRGVWDIVAVGAIVAGDRLIAAAGGLVSSAGAAPDARTVIGIAQADAANGAKCPVRLTL